MHTLLICFCFGQWSEIFVVRTGNNAPVKLRTGNSWCYFHSVCLYTICVVCMYIVDAYSSSGGVGGARTVRFNKGTILKASVEYIKQLQAEQTRLCMDVQRLQQEHVVNTYRMQLRIEVCLIMLSYKRRMHQLLCNEVSLNKTQLHSSFYENINTYQLPLQMPEAHRESAVAMSRYRQKFWWLGGCVGQCPICCKCRCLCWKDPSQDVGLVF